MDTVDQIQNMLVSTVAANVDGILVYKLEETFKHDWNMDLRDQLNKFGVATVTDLVLQLKGRLRLLGNMVYPVPDENIQDVVDLITESKNINMEEKYQKDMKYKRDRERGRSSNRSLSISQKAKSFFSSSNSHIMKLPKPKPVVKSSVNMIPLPNTGEKFGSFFSSTAGSNSVMDFINVTQKRGDGCNAAVVDPPCSNVPSTSYSYGNPPNHFFLSAPAPGPRPPIEQQVFGNSTQKPINPSSFQPATLPHHSYDVYKENCWYETQSQEAQQFVFSNPSKVSHMGIGSKTMARESNPFGDYPVAPSSAEFGVPKDSRIRSKKLDKDFNFSPEKKGEDKGAGLPNQPKKNSASIPEGYKRSITGYINSNQRNMYLPPSQAMPPRSRFASSLNVESSRGMFLPNWEKVLVCVRIVHERVTVKLQTLEKLIEKEFGRPIDKHFLKEVFGVEVQYLYKAMMMMRDSVFKYTCINDTVSLKWPYEEIVAKFGPKKVSEVAVISEEEVESTTLNSSRTRREPNQPEYPGSGDDGFDTTLLTPKAVSQSETYNQSCPPNAQGFKSYRKREDSGSESGMSQSSVLDYVNHLVLPDEDKDFNTFSDVVNKISGTAFYINETIHRVLMIMGELEGETDITIPEIVDTYREKTEGQEELTVDVMNKAFGLSATTLEDAFSKLPQFFTVVCGAIIPDTFVGYYLQKGYIAVFDDRNRIKDGALAPEIGISTSCLQNPDTLGFYLFPGPFQFRHGFGVTL